MTDHAEHGIESPVRQDVDELVHERDARNRDRQFDLEPAVSAYSGNSSA